MSDYEIKNSKPVCMSDRVRFRCIRCTKCCRNVKGTVVIESFDAWRMAKHLNITVTEFYNKYTDMFFMENVNYPVFALKTVGKDNSCVFLQGKKCSVQECKPRTCKMYPFWIEPRETPDKFIYNFSTEQPHHKKGSVIRVKDWMKDNLSDEDARFLAEEYKAIIKIAPLYNAIRERVSDDTELLRIILMYRFYFYETDEPFFKQYERNTDKLILELESMLEELKSGRESKKMNEKTLSPLSVRITKAPKNFISRFLDITIEELDTYSVEQIEQMVENTVEQMPVEELKQFTIELNGGKREF